MAPRPMDMAEHLLPRQFEPDRALEPQRRHHRQEELVLRPQARTEAAADIRRDDADIVARQTEDRAHIGLAVLDALRLVVDGDLAVAMPDHGRGMRFHRVVMLGRDRVLGADADGCLCKSLDGVATRLGRRRDAHALLGRLVALVSRPVHRRSACAAPGRRISSRPAGPAS